MNSSHPLRRPLLPLMCTTLAPTCQTCPILLHRLSRLFSCFHNHLLNKALFRISNFLIPKPPNFLSMHTVFQPSRCNFLPSTSTSPKRSLCNFSNLVLTFLRILKRGMKHLGGLERMLLMWLHLPLLDKYCLIHEANLRLDLFSTWSHTVLD